MRYSYEHIDGIDKSITRFGKYITFPDYPRPSATFDHSVSRTEALICLEIRAMKKNRSNFKRLQLDGFHEAVRH
jgi:hypothetical protein